MERSQNPSQESQAGRSSLELLLKELVEQASIHGALLATRNGVRISHYGAFGQGKNPHAVAAVAAGAFLGLLKVSELLGDENVLTSLQQGAKKIVQTDKITDEVFLVVVFEDPAAIGRVRLALRRYHDRLVELVKRTRERPVEPSQWPDAGFNSQALGMLDEMFKS